MSNEHTETYKITITSPHGKQAVESWEHWMSKVSDEAKERWGIDITIKRFDPESVSTDEFS